MHLAVANDGPDDARVQVDAPDGVALGVCNVDAALGTDRDALGPREPGKIGAPAVAAVALLTRARDVVDRPGLHIDAIDSVAFAQGEKHVAMLIEGDGARSVQWSAR